MVCKKCGCDTLLNNGEWLVCPVCGAEYYNIDFALNKNSATKQIEIIDNKDESGDLSAPSVNGEKVPPKSETSSDTPETENYGGKVSVDESRDTKNANEAQSSAEETDYGFVSEEETETEISSKPEENDTVDEYFENAEEKNDVKENNFTDGIDSVFYDEEFSQNEDFDETDEENESGKRKKRRGKGKKEDKKSSKLKDTVEFLLPIFIALIVALILKRFVIANAFVPTGSMTPTINAKENIIASRLAYINNSPKRYDILLFYYPDDESQIYVKRLIASSGETLTVIDGIAHVKTKDGKELITDQSFANPSDEPRGNFGPYYVPEKGEIITAQGDMCYAENGLVVGNSEFLEKYCVKDGNGNYVIAENLYFMMGDNRNTSLDSRSWKFAYVAEDKIIGKVLFKYWPKFEKLN